MHEHQLDVDTLADVFRHGEEGTNGKITRQYANYAVGLYYRYDEAENWLFRYLLSASIHAHFRPTPHESASYSRS
jgi:hypothetical protein